MKTFKVKIKTNLSLQELEKFLNVTIKYFLPELDEKGIVEMEIEGIEEDDEM